MVQMTASKLLVLGVCMAFAVATTIVGFGSARPAPEKVVAMAEALKMLQQLDKHYAQMSKPRTFSLTGTKSPRSHGQPTEINVRLRSENGRSFNVKLNQDYGRLLHLLELDRQYSHLTKPRFGRSLNRHPMHDMIENDLATMQEGVEEYRR